MQRRGYHFSFIFLSHSTEKFRKRSLLCFRNVLLWKKFMDKIWGYHKFPSEIFRLTVPKNFVGEPFNISENLGYRKILCIRRGYRYSLLNFFCLTVPKKFVRELFCVSKKFRYRKFSCIGKGGIVEKSFVSQNRNEKLGNGTLLFSRKFLVSKKFFG